MIIKSMSRKKASFSQLIDYMNKELSSPHTIGHNIYTHERGTQAEIIEEFERNAQYLPKRKNGNYLYHEVISFEKNDIAQSRMDEIIIELAELYLSERAPKQLAYAVIHRDTEKPHIHFCISANEFESNTRKRLTKKKFAQVQKNLEAYVQEKFPELENRPIYKKERDPEKTKETSREQELKKRTLKASKKDLLKNRLHGLFELSNSNGELETHLEKEGYKIYTRGKNVGIEKTDTGKKHRFNTLGVMEHYLSALERFDSLDKEQRLQAQSKQQELKQKAEQEQQKREEQQRQAELQEQERIAEEERRRSEAKKQAELKAEQQRAAEEECIKAEQQKHADMLAEQQRKKEAQKKQCEQENKQKAAQTQEPTRAQRAEYEAEKAAEERRREAFISQQTGKRPKQEKSQQKPTKTQRRQRAEQVRKAEEKKQRSSSYKHEQGRGKPVKPTHKKEPVPQSKEKTSRPSANKEVGKGKSRMYTPKTQDEVFEESKKKIKKGRSDNERDYLTRREKEDIMHNAPNTKESDHIRDRLKELDTIFTKKDKNKDRER